MHVSRGAQSTLERYAVRAEAVFNRVPYNSATKTTLSSRPSGETLCVQIALCAPAGATGLGCCERKSQMYVS